MTREELFSVFPRPWRLAADQDSPGVVVDATGREVLVVDTLSERADEDAIALAEVLVELGNGAEE